MSFLSLAEFRSGVPANHRVLFRATDLGMLVLANSKERDQNDWIELLREADAGFVFKAVITPPKSELAVVEAVWEGPSASQT